MSRVLIVVLLAVSSFASVAGESAVAELKNKLAQALPGLTPDRVTESPIPGVFEVTYGARFYYVSADARYLLQGDVIDLETRQSITEPRRNQARAGALEKISEDDMIVFSPDKPEYTVTVFTDIDCTYCRKLHSEIEQYNEKGIKIRYLMFPRGGARSPVYKKSVSVWCSDDRPKSLTRAKQGGKVEDVNCENPVLDHFALGQAMGVRGTPALVLESGEMLPGYVPPSRLRARLDKR